MTEILNLFNPEIVFSLIFFLGFIGLGWWFYNQLWPWFVQHRRQALEMSHQIEIKRLEADERQDRRWSDALANSYANYNLLREEIISLRAELQSFLEAISKLLERVVGDGE